MSINKQAIKDYALFAYVVATLLGAYTVVVFYKGMQYNAHADNQVVVTTSKAPAHK